MCLVVKRTNATLIAEEDIPCVKVLKVKSKWNGNIYTTPYMGCIVKPRQIIESKLIRERAWGAYDTVDIGIHTFKADAKEAIEAEILWFNSIFLKTVAVECIIPKGASYCIGSFGSKIDVCYASTRLIYPRKFPRN